MVRRKADWRARLAAYLAREQGRPFQYGVSDCALFAAGAVNAMTGHDPAKGFRGRYRTLTGGMRKLRRAGHASLEAMMDASFERIAPAAMRAGDIAGCRVPDGDVALGVCVGEAVRVRMPAGLGTLHVCDVHAGWRVP